jgi:hypothetical protein
MVMDNPIIAFSEVSFLLPNHANSEVVNYHAKAFQHDAAEVLATEASAAEPFIAKDARSQIASSSRSTVFFVV